MFFCISYTYIVCITYYANIRSHTHTRIRDIYRERQKTNRHVDSRTRAHTHTLKSLCVSNLEGKLLRHNLFSIVRLRTVATGILGGGQLAQREGMHAQSHGCAHWQPAHL